jgi:Ser/Thr protein kinase RdoA (MazF antagonist)
MADPSRLLSVISTMWGRDSARLIPYGTRAMSETWRVEFADGKLPRLAVLKPLPAGGSGSALVARLRLIQWLHEQGVSQLRIAPTVYGTQAALLDDGSVFVLYEWVEGEEFSLSQPNAFREGGLYLGEFHRAVAVYEDRSYPTPESGVAPLWREEIARRAQVLVDTECPTRWLDRIARALDELRPAGETLPALILHGDYRAQNVRFQRGRARALLDFDHSVYGERLADLAYALLFYASVYRGGPMTPEQARELLLGYEEQMPLVGEERGALGVWLRLALWRGVSLWLALHYARGFPARVLSWARLFADSTDWLDGYAERAIG